MIPVAGELLYLPTSVRKELASSLRSKPKPIQIRFRTPTPTGLPRQPYMLEFFAYQTVGECIGHVGALHNLQF